MQDFISKVLTVFYHLGKAVFWLVSTVVLAIVGVLQYMGLWEIPVFCGLVGFFGFVGLDLMSKATKYIKAFGSLKEAKRKGAWRTNLNRKMNMIKMSEYFVVFAAAAGFLFLTNLVWTISIDLGVVLINITTLYTIIFVLLSFNELNSIFHENLIGDFTDEERKRWVNPEVEYDRNALLAEEPDKWKVIYLIATSFMVTLKDALVDALSGLKNLMKGGK